MTAYPPSTMTAPVPGGPTRIQWVGILAIGVLIAAAVGVLVGRISSGSSHSTAASTPPATSTSSSSGTAGGSLSTPHGPARFTDGIPTGYSHDAAGAATAAVNAVQVTGLCTVGKLDPAKVQQQLAAAGIDAASLKNLAPTGGTTHGSAADRVSLRQPGAVHVDSISPTAATVRVWYVDFERIDQGNVLSQTVTANYYTVQLIEVWENGDWKVKTQTGSNGPLPGSDASNPANGGVGPWAGGQFTVLTG